MPRNDCCCHHPSTCTRSYAALMLARGELAAAIRQVQERLRSQPDAAGYRRLSHLLRAKGDRSGAIDAANKTGDEALVDDLLFEAGDWRQLAKRRAGEPAAQALGALAVIDHLGYSAAYHRLAGNVADFERAVDEITRYGRETPNNLWFAAKVLLINEQFDAAAELCFQNDRATAFEILCDQGRVGEAFQRAGLGPPSSFRPEEMRLTRTKNAVAAGRDFALACEVARVLHRLGEKKKAIVLAGRLASLAAQAPDQQRPGLLSSLARCEMAVGLVNEAFKHAAANPRQRPEDAFSYDLFGKQSELARVLWRALREEYPNDRETSILERLRGLLAKRAAPPPSKELSSLADRVEKFAASAPAEKHSPQRALLEMASFLANRGQPALAIACAEKAAARSDSPDVAIRLGDLLAEQGRWADAARAYAAAHAKDSRRADALYLLGRANVRLGKAAEGRRLIETALLLPLGDAGVRFQLVETLRRLNLDDEALRQCELVVRTGNPHDWALKQCLKALGNAASARNDYLTAADCWEKLLLSCLPTSTGFLHVKDYLTVSVLIHNFRARASEIRQVRGGDRRTPQGRARLTDQH